MKLKPCLEACLGFSKLAAVVICLAWLFIVTRYLQIRPEYATRQYLQSIQNNIKLSGVVRMNKVLRFKPNPVFTPFSKTEKQNFNFFELLQLSQAKNRIDCENRLQLLIINANYNTVRDSYFSIYKQIERQDVLCKNQVFQLNRKGHLLMDSQQLISQYAIEISITIKQFVTQNPSGKNLVLLTFEEGSVLLLKALQYLPIQVILRLESVILLNMYNPSFQILHESPRKYVSAIQQRLMLDHAKLKVLNQTRLIFISTKNFWDPTFYEQQDEQKFSFLWGGSKLQKTIFLNTRFMRNIYMLLHDKDYFSSNLVDRLVKYILNAKSFKKTKQIQYFFKNGDVHTRAEPDLKEIQSKFCTQGRLSTLTKITKIHTTICLQLQISKRMQQKENQTMLIITSKNSYIFNNFYERIEPVLQLFGQRYFLFDHVKKTNQIWVINIDRSLIEIEFHNPYNPATNPLPNKQIFVYSPTNYFSNTYKQLAESRMLIKVCPHGDYLIFPQHFYNNLTESLLHTVFALYNLNKILTHFDVTKRTQKNYQNITNCYPDLLSQFLIVPKQFELNWHRERNILIFVLLCSRFNKKSIFQQLLFYLSIAFAIHCLYRDRPSQSVLQIIAISLLITTIGISIQTCINTIIHLVKFIQDMLDVRYRQLMLLLILLASLIKQAASFQQLSAWKLLCISLIFVVNKRNMLVLMIKMYYLYDHIIYNHNSCTEMIFILFWIYINLESNSIETGKSQVSEIGSVVVQKEDPKKSGITELCLIMFYGFWIDGPAYLNILGMNGYIVIKSIQHMLQKAKGYKQI